MSADFHRVDPSSHPLNRFGQSQGPLDPIVVARSPLERLQQKEWHFLSIDTREFFVVFALAGAPYLSQIFAYYVDKANGQMSVLERRSPLGLAMRFSEAPTRGRSSWRQPGVQVDIDEAWRVTLRVDALQLEGALEILHEPGLSLLFDLRADSASHAPRAAYTYKLAGAAVRGHLQIRGRAIDLEGATAISDWTRARSLRDTRWKWCALSGVVDGARVGLNLSAQVYDRDDASQENACWREGELQLLGGAQFRVPKRPGLDPWQIKTRDRRVDLRFFPVALREQHLNLGLLRSDFVQACGRFEGTLDGLEIEGLFGLMEDHRARW